MKNVLPAPYSPRTALNAEPPGRDRIQVGVQGGQEPVQPHGELIESADRDGSPAQGVDDLAPPARRGRSRRCRHDRHTELLAEQPLVKDHGGAVGVDPQDRIALDVQQPLDVQDRASEGLLRHGKRKRGLDRAEPGVRVRRTAR